LFVVGCWYSTLLDQATDPPPGNTNEVRLVAEAGAAEKKVLLELDEEKRKQAQSAEDEQAQKPSRCLQMIWL
jgi:hypothetical protein